MSSQYPEILEEKLQRWEGYFSEHKFNEMGNDEKVIKHSQDVLKVINTIDFVSVEERRYHTKNKHRYSKGDTVMKKQLVFVYYLEVVLGNIFSSAQNKSITPCDLDQFVLISMQRTKVLQQGYSSKSKSSTYKRCS